MQHETPQLLKDCQCRPLDHFWKVPPALAVVWGLTGCPICLVVPKNLGCHTKDLLLTVAFSQLPVPKAVRCSSSQLTLAMAAEIPVKHVFTPMVIHLSDPVWDRGALDHTFSYLVARWFSEWLGLIVSSWSNFKKPVLAGAGPENSWSADNGLHTKGHRDHVWQRPLTKSRNTSMSL